MISLVLSTNCTLAGNSLQNPLYYSFPIGIYLKSTNDTAIDSNSQVGSDGKVSGIILDDSSNNTVTSNMFDKSRLEIIYQSNYNSVIGNNFSTVRLYKAYFNNITDNQIHGSPGFDLSFGQNNFIAQNTISTGAYAFKLWNFNDNIFQKNVFSGYIWDWGADTRTSTSINVWL
jgi:parallel beta-helix repeat protein